MLSLMYIVTSLRCIYVDKKEKKTKNEKKKNNLKSKTKHQFQR